MPSQTDAVIVHLSKFIGASIKKTLSGTPLTVTIFITGHTGRGKG
jgi:hypothetical protein